LPKRIAIKMIETARDKILFYGRFHSGHVCPGAGLCNHHPILQAKARGNVPGGFQNVRQRAMGGPLPLEESTMTD